MNEKEILIDTNIALYLLNGSTTLADLLQGKNPYISFITELELIGFKTITSKEEKQIVSFINDCTIVSLSNNIKLNYVSIRRKYKLKLADSIIAATAISLNLPMITGDKQFRTIEELNLIFYEQ